MSNPAISNRSAWFATEPAPPGGYRSHQRQCRNSGRRQHARRGQTGGDRWGGPSCHRKPSSEVVVAGTYRTAETGACRRRQLLGRILLPL